MSCRVEVTPGAAREIKKLPTEAAAQVVTVLEALAEDPRPSGAKRIEGIHDCYRVRAGAYRVVYVIEGDVLSVSIITVGHRREVYRRLREKLGRRSP